MMYGSLRVWSMQPRCCSLHVMGEDGIDGVMVKGDVGLIK